MMIDKVGGASPSYGPRKPDATQKTSPSAETSDRVTISTEAAQAREAAQFVSLVKTTEDTSRSERLKEIKQRLEKGEYDNLSDETLGKIADRLQFAIQQS